MESKITQYGIITGGFTPEPQEVTWEFKKYDSDENFETLNGIETLRDMTNENVTIIGNAKEFKKWRLECPAPFTLVESE